MRKRNLCVFFLAAGLLLCITRLNIAQPTPRPHSAVAQEQPQQQPEKQKQATFSGKIAQSEGKFVLQESSGTTYNLDDQDKAKQYDGQNVKVTGTLDAESRTIHVTDIQPA